MELGQSTAPLRRDDCDRDTIVALATSPGPAALATLRLTGRRVREILDYVLRRPGSTLAPVLVARRATLAHFVDPADGATIDEVVVTLFAAPRSYTGEDLAEVSLHGGPWLVGEALRVLTSLGASQARPGEFTRRALRAGKLDLARAEAVQALVLAQSSAAAKLAAGHLAGALSERFQRIRRELVALAACLEGPLEFPEDTVGDDEDAAREALEILDRVQQALEALVRSHTRARRVVSGVAIPIVGRPNVGKSSVFNGLLGTSRAIVSPRAGTTRDCIEASILVRGRLVRLIDTAGLGAALDELDAEAMRRTLLQIEGSDAVLLVLDRSAPAHEWDRDLASKLAGRPVIVVLNKSDLEPQLGSTALATLDLPSAPAAPVAVSAVDGRGLSDLVDRIAQELEGLAPPGEDPEDVVSSARQQALLVRALADLARARENVELGRTELAIEDVRLAELSLAEILGDSSPDEVLDEVFRTFCIGK